MTKTAVAQHPTTADTRTHYVYRLYDAGDRLLYVGMTNDPGQRLREHKRSQPWWSEVSRHTLEETPTRADAFFKEAAAILKERPAYNQDIPSLHRYDVLRSRTTEADPLTDEDRIASLEHQLRQARRELHRLSSDERSLESLQSANASLTAQNKRLRKEVQTTAEEARAAAESHSKTVDSLLSSVEFWRGLVDSKEAELAAREQPRIFVVEAPAVPGNPRPEPAVVPAAPVVRAAPRRSLLQRFMGGPSA